MNKINRLVRCAAFFVAAPIFSTQANAATVIGLNFARDAGGETTGSADGLSDWTNVYDDNGFNGSQAWTLLGSNSYVAANWVAANSWYSGSNVTPEHRIYACYLDDGDTSAGGLIGATDGDGIGVRVQLTGLGAWMASEGLSSYSIRIYSSTDTGGGTFQDVTLRAGDSGGSALETIAVPVLGDGEYPISEGGSGGVRGYADFAGAFTTDTITFTLPSRNGNQRGTLAAIKITGIPDAIPEPSALAFLPIGVLVLSRRRR